MSASFCQEYSKLLDLLESVRNENKRFFKSIVLNPDIKVTVDEYLDREMQINDVRTKMEALLESTTLEGYGREIRQLELIGLEMIARDLDKELQELYFLNKDGRIHQLDLSYLTHFSNLEPLRLLKSLEDLRLQKTAITDISLLEKLLRLKSLDLGET